MTTTAGRRARVRPAGRAAAVVAVVLTAQWISGAALTPIEGVAGTVGAAGPLVSVGWGVAALLLSVLAVRAPLLTLLPLGVLALPWIAPHASSSWVFAGPAAAFAWTVSIINQPWRPTDSAGLRSLTRLMVAPIALGVAWLGTAATLLTPVAMSGDAPHYLTAAQSLVRDGDFDLRNNYDERTHAPFYAGSLEPRHTNDSPWGEQYPFHGLGTSVLVAPAFRLWGARGATWTLVLVMALGAAVVWETVRSATGELTAAWFSWVTLVGSATYTLHAAAIYPDGPAAVAVAGAMWLLVRVRRGGPVALGTLALVGAGLAALPWLHVRLAWLAAVFGAAGAVAVLRRQPEPWTRLSWFLMVPAISCAGWVGASQVMFGTWNPAAAMLQRTAPGALSTAPAGLFGLLADQEFGLLPANPQFLLVPVALVALLRANAAAGVAGTSATLGVLLMSSLWVWWGGDSAPARFLTPVLPVLSVALGVLWAGAAAGLRRVLGLSLAFGVVITGAMVLLDGGAHAYNFPDGRGSVFESLSSAVDLSLALPSMLRPGATLGSEAPIAGVWLLAAIVGGALTGAWPSRWRAWPELSGFGVLVVGSLAAGTAWSLRDAPAFTASIASARVLTALAAQHPADVALLGTSLAGSDLAGRLRLRTPESVAAGDGVLVYVPHVPAGRYRIRVLTNGPADGEAVLQVGRDIWPYATWRLTDPPPLVVLAGDVHSVRIDGPKDAIDDLWLEPVARPASPGYPEARRLYKVGDVDVYALDDASYPEPGGLWTGANRTTSLLLAVPAPSDVVAHLQAGPAAIRMRLDHGSDRSDVDIGPEGTAQAALGTLAPQQPVLLRLTTRGGFPGRTLREGDSRSLGAWVTFAATPR
ncbi:MAG: hypothetical protein AB7O28_10110 [Vicinamibacterales bacterium]